MEPQSLLVTRHDLSTFPNIGILELLGALKKFGRKNFIEEEDTVL